MKKYTKYEKARLIGSRALQISMGAPFLVKLSEKDLEAIGYNPIEIAKKEFDADLLPITIKYHERKAVKKEAKAAA
ncbi:DNA-directed RNA polymerase subunit K [Candidatus Woesearchaeota archaeon CG10_big_fil_rev_8_21_14_0_10_37_12]|nr:MAG: DNA-directed RNA polymerase subunit K [Candidatus Woesearchaeota archaeon CG10_big_fil_rev_8_21_14_0_10_37_12]